MNSVIYDLQFGFRQKYSASHALIHLTDKIREQLDSGIFVDLQKAFRTVDHDILIQKLRITRALDEYQTIGFHHIFRIDCNKLV